MKAQLRKLLWIVPGALVVMGSHGANAQDLSGMTPRDMLLKIRTMNVEQMNQIVRTCDRDAMAQIIRSMDAQTMSNVALSLDPSTMSEVAKRILVEFARVRPKSVVATSKASESRSSPSTAGNETAGASVAGSGRKNRAPDGEAPEDVQEEQMNLNGITVITHPSNLVDGLTVDQIGKIYTGQYDNWRQVGGPDLQVKVMIVGESPEVQAKLTSNANVSAFASSVFMGVASTSGAVGFVPEMHSRQLRFIGGHEAVKIVAVR